MNLTSEQMDELLKLVGLTRPQELNCNECLDLVGEFAEHRLQGAQIPDALEAVEHHLSVCAECREEYEALLKALQVLHDESGGDKGGADEA